jgi:hypothetical protein
MKRGGGRGRGAARTSRARQRLGLLCDVSLAARVAALAGDLGGVFMRFAIGAAILLVGGARTSGVGTLFSICHIFVFSFGTARWAILPLGCKFGEELWQARSARDSTRNPALSGHDDQHHTPRSAGVVCYGKFLNSCFRCVFVQRWRDAHFGARWLRNRYRGRFD